MPSHCSWSFRMKDLVLPEAANLPCPQHPGLLPASPTAETSLPTQSQSLLMLLGAVGNSMLMLLISICSLSAKWQFCRYWGKQGGINTQQKLEEKSMYVGKVQTLLRSIFIN